MNRYTSAIPDHQTAERVAASLRLTALDAPSPAEARRYAEGIDE